MFLRLAPDETIPGEPSAENENTDPGEPSDPSRRSDNRDIYVAKGIQIGIERALKKLGFSDIDSAREELGSLRSGNSRKENPEEDDTRRQELDDKVRESRKEALLLKRELEKREEEIESLREQSDEARLMKLRATALENGVGKGRQLDAFVKLYGDEVAFDDERNLVVLSKLPDGSREPMGESIKDFIKKALERDPFLKPYDSTKGSGSRPRPTGDSNPSDVSPLAQQIFGQGASSGRDLIFGRSKKE